MQFKPIAAITILLLVVASLSVAGCTVNTTSPTTSPSPTPVPDYAKTLNTQILENNPNNTVVNPMSLVSNKTFVGTYHDKEGNDSTWKVQLFDNEGDARAAFSGFIMQKTEAGFKGNHTTITNSVFGPAKGNWSGSKVESLLSASVVVAVYGHNDDINQWFFSTISMNLGV